MKNSEHLFLLNLPIKIELKSGQLLLVKTPSIEEYESNNSYYILTSIFNISLLELQLNPEYYGFKADTYLDTLVGVRMLSEFEDALNLLQDICGIAVEKSGVFFKGKELVEDDILEIRKIYLISVGHLNIDGSWKDNNSKSDREKETQDKIDSIRKANGKSSKGKSYSSSELIKLLLYEVGMSIDSILKLNYFGLAQLGSLALFAPADKINKVAAGNGHMKKFEDIIENTRGE